MNRIVALTFTLLGLLSLYWPGVAVAETVSTAVRNEPRVALVIGNSSYERSPLRNPQNDARLVAKTLESVGFRVILRLDADQREMKRAIEEFGRELESARAGNGVGLFYFAGHGIQLNGRNYLVPVGADIDTEGEVDIESVDVARVLTKMDKAKPRVNLVILDACRNNPFARSFRSTNRGLAFVSAPQGTLIAYATAPGDVAQDGPGENGTYTSALVRELGREGVPVERVLKRVRTRVKKATQGRQIPWESSSLEGEFYFKLPSEDTVAGTPGVVPVPGTADREPPAAVSGPPGAAKPAPPKSGDATPLPDPGDEPRAIGGFDGSTFRLPKDVRRDEPPPPPPEPDDGSTQRTLGYVSLGLGGAGVALGVVAKVLAAGPEENLSAVCVDGQCPDTVQSDKDDFDAYKTLNTVGYIAGGGLAGLGLVLVFTAPDGSAETGAQVEPYVAGAGGGVRGRF